MRTTTPYDLSQLADPDLLARLGGLVTRDHELTAERLAHLAEVDARRLYLPAACSSRFTYCVQILGLSEDATYKRLQAARAARRYPVIFARVARGELHLSAVTLLAPHLTDENHQELLRAAEHKSKRQVEQLLARRCPQPDVPAAIRKLPAVPAPAPPAAPGAAPTARGAAPAPGQVPAAAARAPRPPVVVPLAPARYQVQFTASQALHDKLQQAHDLLRPTVPAGDLAQVIERGLDALLRELRRRKFAATTAPRPRVGAGRAGPPRRRRYLPAAVRRAVAERDGEQCTFVDPTSGRRCPQRAFLQYHHLDPYAQGGGHTVAKVTLRCQPHNLHAAAQDYGAELIARRQAAARAPGPLPPPARG